MEQLDYAKLKVKAGLEIHQQLDTHKLFCHCPSILRKDEPQFVIERTLHAVAGEQGVVDAAAAYQAGLETTFVYQGHDSTCLVELDEEPPHHVNSEALQTTLHIALLLHATIMPITQIMRKTVIDGSNTSGFQRTMLIARDGYVDTTYGRVGIASICLEEDAARIIEKQDSKTIYRLDRLGIPLIEIATDPDIKHPEQAKEVALFIGDILRSSAVKRGLGTIRQDVNVSILGNSRVELKGVQDPDTIILAMNHEIRRQKAIIDQKKDVTSEVRKANPDGTTEFLRPMPGAARMYPETDLPLLEISRAFIDHAKKTLPKLRAEIEKELLHEGLPQELTTLLFQQGLLHEYKALYALLPRPAFIGKILLLFPKELAAKHKLSEDAVSERLTQDIFSFLVEEIRNERLSESHAKPFLEKVLQGMSALEARDSFSGVNDDALSLFVAKLIREKPGLTLNAYMGLVMKEFKGSVDGAKTIEIIKKNLPA